MSPQSDQPLISTVVKSSSLDTLIYKQHKPLFQAEHNLLFGARHISNLSEGLDDRAGAPGITPRTRCQLNSLCCTPETNTLITVNQLYFNSQMF